MTSWVWYVLLSPDGSPKVISQLAGINAGRRRSWNELAPDSACRLFLSLVFLPAGKSPPVCIMGIQHQPALSTGLSEHITSSDCCEYKAALWHTIRAWMADTVVKGHSRRQLITLDEEVLIIISYKQGSFHCCDQSSRLDLLRGWFTKQRWIIRQCGLEVLKYWSGRCDTKSLARWLLSVES